MFRASSFAGAAVRPSAVLLVVVAPCDLSSRRYHAFSEDTLVLNREMLRILYGDTLFAWIRLADMNEKCALAAEAGAVPKKVVSSSKSASVPNSKTQSGSAPVL